MPCCGLLNIFYTLNWLYCKWFDPILNKCLVFRQRKFSVCIIIPWNQRLMSSVLLSAQVSPIIINTVITIQSALTPTAETPEELDSPVPIDLWEKRGWKELKFWFLEEEGDDDTRSLVRLIPQGESLQVFSCIVTQLIILYGWLFAIISSCVSWHDFFLQFLFVNFYITLELFCRGILLYMTEWKVFQFDV